MRVSCVVCSTNLGFSVGYACVRLILALVRGTYYAPHTYVPGISRLPRYVYDTRYVLCTRYVCTWYQPADERSARGRTRLTTVTCISCRSLWRQLLLYLYFIFIPITFIRAKRVSNCYIPKKKFARVRVCACVRVILLLVGKTLIFVLVWGCLLYTSPSPRD